MSDNELWWENAENVDYYLDGEDLDEDTPTSIVRGIILTVLGVTPTATQVSNLEKIISRARGLDELSDDAALQDSVAFDPAGYISGTSWNASSDFPRGEWFHAGNLLVDSGLLVITDLAVPDRVPSPTELSEISDWEYAAEIPWSLGFSGVVVNVGGDGVYPVELLVDGTSTKGVRVMFFGDDDGGDCSFHSRK